MGHIQYFLQYKNQSYFYLSGANPGFHEVSDRVRLYKSWTDIYDL